MMHPDLLALLTGLRARRGFDPGRYIQVKSALLGAYLRRSGVRACVVAVSGGVDSAVTLGLVCQAARAPGSPIEQVVAALMPLFVPAGATHQGTALDRGHEVARAFGARVAVVDLSQTHAAAMAAVEAGLGVQSSPWAAGQLVSNIRTPALYHLATLLTQQGTPALICGTTNRDEGSYLGFFGKASDGMVDLQLISDLHKSEVFAVARRRGVPASVVDATPTGDTYDGRPDEAMIGAPYDFVELYTALRCLALDEQRGLIAGLAPDAAAQFDAWARAVEALHRVNAHKYLGDSPAVHLDVFERAVPGGWRAPAPRPPHPVDHRAFVAEFSLPPALVDRLAGPASRPLRAGPLFDDPAAAFLVPGLLAPDECEALLAEALRNPSLPAGRHGSTRDADLDEGACSWRSSVFDERLAAALWARLAPVVPPVRWLDEHASTDGQGHPAWRAVGVSPLFRFIRYERGGWLVPHHDAGHDAGDGLHHTLMSVLIYLTAPTSSGGATRFLLDPQRHLPTSERRFADGEFSPSPRDILLALRPSLGSALLFDHRLPHDAEFWAEASPRLVLRTDIVFARCGLPALATSASTSAPGSSSATGSGLASGLGNRVSGEASGSVPAIDSASGEASLSLLGLSSLSPRPEVDAAYLSTLSHRENSPALRTSWKIFRDPFYGRVHLSLGSLRSTEEAGFFDDGGNDTGDDPRSDPRWSVTPLGMIHERLAAWQRLRPPALSASSPGSPLPWFAVLLSTGSFCPVHRGHLRMMELAKNELERRGAVVLGGYLSPSHDRYVQMKCGALNPGAAHRVRMCEEALAHEVEAGEPAWLAVDPWEALHAPVALNFTEVIDRLERHLSVSIKTSSPLQVVYIFGGDNARFSLSFLHRGRSLCIPRPGQERRLAPYVEHPLLRGNARVMFAAPDPAAIDASSSQIREGAGDELIPAGARGLWASWRAVPPASPRRLRLLVRDEGDWCLGPWLSGRDEGAVRGAREVFLAGLLGAFREAAAQARPDEAIELSIEVLSLAEQRARVAEVTAGRRVISLDPCIAGDINLGVSRVVPLGGHADAPRFVGRPDDDVPSKLLDFCPQEAAIPPGEHVLLDDDAVSGATLDHVRAVLARRCPQVTLGEVVIASDLVARGPLGALPRQGVEVCDSRDFLVGSRGGGLVVGLPGAPGARAPYLLPYVQPSRRASVPLSREIAFSRRVWRLNAEFFASVASPLRVADASAPFRALASHLGFDEQTTLEELCRWHAGRLGDAGEGPGSSPGGSAGS